ncbi:MAG TPA: phosphatidylglycerol lysyltransferase domain-containing protein [Ktedonobacterales bacterium]
MQMRIAGHRGSEHALAARLSRLGRGALALLVLVAASANVVSAFASQPWRPASLVEQVIDFDGLGWGRVGVLTAAALLVLVAHALARGKRQAWVLAVCLLSLSLLLEILEGARTLSMLVMIALLAVLLALAPLFPTRSHTVATVRGYGALAVGGWLTWLHTFLFNGWHAGVWPIPFGPVGALLIVTRLVTYAILGYGVAQLLRPAVIPRATRAIQREEREHALALIAQHGYLSTVYFTRGADKSYFWSASGRSLIAYRVTLGVALALADPIGPVEEREAIVRDFIAYCRQQDWQVAFYQTTPGVRRLCRAMGMHAFKIGEDAIVDLARFTLQGKIGAPVRHSLARARRGGLRVQIFQGVALPDPIFASMRRISTAWLHKQKATIQFGYSMGRFPYDWTSELLTAVALGPDDEVQAYVTWTPLYAGQGWALDNMRRADATEPGAMELLLAECIAWAKERGCKRMTLGLAPLAGLDAPPCEFGSAGVAGPSLITERATLLERSAAYLHRRGLLLGNYRSLHAFKAKFQAEWEPRYMVVGELSAVPQVLSALGVAMGVGWRGLVRDAWEALHPSGRQLAAAAAPVTTGSSSASTSPSPAPEPAPKNVAVAMRDGARR